MARGIGRRLLCAVAAAAATLVVPAAASADDRAPAPTLLVTAASGVTDAALAAAFEQAGVQAIARLEPLPIYRVAAASDAAARAALERLGASPLVRSAEMEGEQRLAVTPNDALYRPYQWNLQRIGMEQVWDLRPTAPEIVVAVLDTGVDLTHPDLQANLLVDQGYDFVNDTPSPQDDESHGTAVAGIVGAIGNNREGVAGIAWRVRILPLKVLNARGRGPDSATAKAILYAADHGARIINISSTGNRYSAALEQAVVYAREKGALIVAAAGNTGDQDNEVTYPAAFQGVLAVTAIDDQNRLAPFAQHGPYVSLAAPGVEVPSTSWPGAGRGLYASQTGTSIAAPHVAGVAALLWSLRPDLSEADVVATLLATAADLGPPGADEGYGSGVLDAAGAVAAIRPGVAPRPTAVQLAPTETPPQPPLFPAQTRRWYFAEGSTRPPFEASFALYNPNPRAASVVFTFLLPDGQRRSHSLLLGAHMRATLSANDVLPAAEFSTIVESDLPVFAERSMYFGHDGHTAAGAREPARTWYLAEGSTVPPFDTWLLVMNPNPAPTTVRYLFMQEDGTSREQLELVPAWGRKALYANVLFRASGFSTQVTADQPVVVERAMYFDAGQGGHGTLATAAPSRTWYLAEGITRGGFDTWLLVQNPGATPASAQVSFLTDDGRVVDQPLLVAPRARATLFANQVIANAVFGIRVTADQPVVVERAVYFGHGRAGFDTAAVPAPATEWYLPEGSTQGSSVEQLSLLNPQDQTALVQVDLRRQDGQSPSTIGLRVGPRARQTLDINRFAPDARVALRVVADRPIVVERTVYFARPDGVGATNSAGQTR